MIIVVNHLTRMHQGRICVAGIDLETRRHVRPVTKWGQLDGRVLAGRSLDGREGPFNMAHVVELGQVNPVPQNPHVEDHSFVPWKARFIERFHADDFWALLYCLRKRLNSCDTKCLMISSRSIPSRISVTVGMCGAMASWSTSVSRTR